MSGSSGNVIPFPTPKPRSVEPPPTDGEEKKGGETLLSLKMMHSSVMNAIVNGRISVQYEWFKKLRGEHDFPGTTHPDDIIKKAHLFYHAAIMLYRKKDFFVVSAKTAMALLIQNKRPNNTTDDHVAEAMILIAWAYKKRVEVEDDIGYFTRQGVISPYSLIGQANDLIHHPHEPICTVSPKICKKLAMARNSLVEKLAEVTNCTYAEVMGKVPNP